MLSKQFWEAPGRVKQSAIDNVPKETMERYAKTFHQGSLGSRQFLSRNNANNQGHISQGSHSEVHNSNFNQSPARNLDQSSHFSSRATLSNFGHLSPHVQLSSGVTNSGNENILLVKFYLIEKYLFSAKKRFSRRSTRI